MVVRGLGFCGFSAFLLSFSSFFLSLRSSSCILQEETDHWHCWLQLSTHFFFIFFISSRVSSSWSTNFDLTSLESLT